MRTKLLIGLATVLSAAPAAAQVQTAPSTSADQDDALLPQQQQPPLDTNQAGRIARSSVGQVGQRQTREAAAEQARIKPMARIVNRIQNRVQTRIRNRIDRNYDPQANATDPFAVAEDQARITGRPRR